MNEAEAALLKISQELLAILSNVTADYDTDISDEVLKYYADAIISWQNEENKE